MLNFLDHNWNCNLFFPFPILNVLTVCRRLSVLIACRTIAFPTKVSKLRMYSRIPVGTMIAAGICEGITSSLEMQSDLNPPYYVFVLKSVSCQCKTIMSYI